MKKGGGGGGGGDSQPQCSLPWQCNRAVLVANAIIKYCFFPVNEEEEKEEEKDKEVEEECKNEEEKITATMQSSPAMQQSFTRAQGNCSFLSSEKGRGEGEGGGGGGE